MSAPHRVVVTGQQIGAGWTPALSVVKALTALAVAEAARVEAVYWMADEDHDRAEVASVVGTRDGRLRRHRFRFAAAEGTATGWLPWTPAHQAEAEALWGEVPVADGTLRDHARALGAPLWRRGLRPFSPTDPEVRGPVQPELERWRAMDLEGDLIAQAERLEAAGVPLPLDPRTQAAWFALDPATGLRTRLERGQPLPKGCWLSPGAALRPLMQSLLLPVEAAVLGPAERAYWRLTEPLWARVGLEAPRIIDRPTVFILPKGARLDPTRLGDLRDGAWERFVTAGPLPSDRLRGEADAAWPATLRARFARELEHTRHRLHRLDRRLHREAAASSLGMDPEALRQALFPFGRPQERVLPGLTWLRDEGLLDRMKAALGRGGNLILLEDA